MLIAPQPSTPPMQSACQAGAETGCQGKPVVSSIARVAVPEIMIRRRAPAKSPARASPARTKAMMNTLASRPTINTLTIVRISKSVVNATAMTSPVSLMIEARQLTMKFCRTWFAETSAAPQT